MIRSLCTSLGLAGLVLAAAPATAQDTTDALIEQERVREAVDEVLAFYLGPPPEGGTRVDLANQAADRLVELGPQAVPHLANELDRENVATFDFAAFALGRLGTAEAEAALRNSLARAHEATGLWARTRKAWTAWGLGLLGRADAIPLANAGGHLAGTYSIHSNTSVLEAVALQTAPDCIPLLLAELERDRDDDERWQERRAVLRALGRVGNASLIPKLVPYLGHKHVIARREAAGALARVGTTEAVDPLLEALGDEDVTVRRFVAGALEQIAAPGRETAIAAWLDKLEDPHARGSLYRWLVLTDRGQALSILSRHTGRAHPQDRIYLTRALGSLEAPQRFELLEQALDDPDNGVALAAVSPLAASGSGELVRRLGDTLLTANWSLAQAIPEHLATRDDPAAAEPIARRLLLALAEPVTEAQIIVPVRKMAGALVELGHTAVLDELRAAVATQNDHRLRPALDLALRKLEAIRRNGKSVSRWVKLLEDPDEEMRELAYARLGRIGTTKATRALVAAFDAAAPDDALGIVRALGSTRSPAAHDLLQRILLDPAFDAPAHRTLRETAGWSARRIDGEAMFELLRAAVERRHGRDAKLTVYAALVGGERALPLIREHRRARMRHVGWNLGDETAKLDWVARRLTQGLPIDSLDRPPALMLLR